MTAPSTEAPPPDGDARRHTALEDAQGVFCGALMAALSLLALQSAGLVTGQIAGLSLVIGYAFDVDVGLVFFLANLPFYGFALRRMGWRFTLKSLLAVSLLSALLWVSPALIEIGRIDPIAAAVIGGVTAAMGLLALFRHGASLGGVGVVAVYLQDATGFKAGWTQLIVDAVVFGLALMVISPWAVAVSFLGAVVLNMMILINHRRDRYVGF